MKSLLLLLFSWPLLAAAQLSLTRVPVIGQPCEGCEAIFEGLPAMIPSRARIAPPSEPGIPLHIEGQVTDATGQPRSGIIIYAYQTNSAGVYPELATVQNRETRRHGTLRGWVKTNDEGRYWFDTIRPGSYPASDLPAHIHFHVLEPSCATYYIDDIMFRDDPKLTEKQLKRLTADRGGSGLVEADRRGGALFVRRDIRLGANIPGYKMCQ